MGIKDTLKNKTFLITGATGFIGSCVARRLIGESERNVHILMRENSDVSRIKDISGQLKMHTVDLRDRTATDKLVRSLAPDIVFHCAVYGAYSSQNDKDSMIETNIRGAMNLLDALADIDYKCFINTGSSSEYGLKRGPMKETDVLEPIDFYGVTKAAAAIMAAQTALTGNKPVTTIRPFSVYGPYETKTRLIPSVIRSCLFGEKMAIRTPRAVHDFVFIEDVVDFFLAVASMGRSFGVLNLGSGRQRSVIQVIRAVEKVTGKKADVEFVKPDRKAVKPDPWIASMSKAKRTLGWKQKTPFEEGISRTADFIRRNQ